MVAKLDGTNGLLQQYDYQTPSTGFSYTFAAGVNVLVMQPAGTLATGAITMPAVPVDGMTITFSSTQAITALTVSANTGQSIVGNPTTMLAGGAMVFLYRAANTTWYAQISTVDAATGGVVLNAYTTPGTWTKPATLKSIKVTVVGGGGSTPTATGVPGAFTKGSGAGGGGAAIFTYPAPSLPGPQPYTVGTAGNTSSFGVAPITVISATGGAAGGINTVGGAGGVGSNGTMNIEGGGGGGTTGPMGMSGTGGSSIYGGGARSQAGTGPFTGIAGGAYGGGASGAAAGNGGAPAAGATGATGVVIIEEFY